MITLSKFIIVKNSFSVISGVLELLQNGQLLLFLIVTGFSILLPILKIALLFLLLTKLDSGTKNLKRTLHLMHEYGRWAMLDVMVVAILIVTVKLGAVASIQVHYGLYVFGSSVLLIMLITHRVVKLTNTGEN
jgi:paraquat-inducible protein A